MPPKLRVLVVDDSTVFRKVVRDALASIPNVELVGHAENGVIALRKIEDLKPDLVTLDIEMPEMSGLELLQAIQAKKLPTSAIMISSLNSVGARATTQALARGAFDFILKPSLSSLAENVAQLQQELEPRIQAFRSTQNKVSTPTRVGRPATDGGEDTLTEVCDLSRTAASSVNSSKSKAFGIPQIVVIGTSTGGPAALNKVLPRLPASFPVPILIVQHMPPMFTKSLADDLNRSCKLEISEAAGGEKLQAGRVFIAPGGRHMKVVRTNGGVFIRVTDDLPVDNCRPSVDYMFRSVRQAYQDGILAVILTGMGSDGSKSLKEMRANGVRVIAQDEKTCTVYGMPRRVIEEETVDTICPLGTIATTITGMVKFSEVTSCN